MNTVKIDNYTFDKVAKTVTFTDFTSIILENIISITDVTNNVQIFYSKLPSFGGTISGNILTLQYDTTGLRFLNADKLLIEYALEADSIIALPSATRGLSTGNSDDIHHGGKGVIVSINTTAASGSPLALVVKLQIKDAVTGSWMDIPGAATASITTTGTTLLAVYPGIAETANAKVSYPLPQVYRIAYAITGTTPSFTFSISANHIK